jgi:hypothetical protein
VDGVLQTLLGQFNAYQIKFRTGRPSLTRRELSTFIGLADSPHIHSRVLLTNCDELPAVLNDRQGFFCIRGSDLDRLEAGDFRAIEAWLAETKSFLPSGVPVMPFGFFKSSVARFENCRRRGNESLIKFKPSFYF